MNSRPALVYKEFSRFQDSLGSRDKACVERKKKKIGPINYNDKNRKKVK